MMNCLASSVPTMAFVLPEMAEYAPPEVAASLMVTVLVALSLRTPRAITNITSPQSDMSMTSLPLSTLLASMGSTVATIATRSCTQLLIALLLSDQRPRRGDGVGVVVAAHPRHGRPGDG